MMAEVPGSEQKMDADLVLIAAGFLGTENYIANAFGVDLNARTNVATAEGAYATNVKKMSSQQAICTEDSRLSCGQSAKAAKLQVKWMKA